jgi:hypothetical protein
MACQLKVTADFLTVAKIAAEVPSTGDWDCANQTEVRRIFAPHF